MNMTKMRNYECIDAFVINRGRAVGEHGARGSFKILNSIAYPQFVNNFDGSYLSSVVGRPSADPSLYIRGPSRALHDPV